MLFEWFDEDPTIWQPDVGELPAVHEKQVAKAAANNRDGKSGCSMTACMSM